jgi:hypothetical protein
MHENKKTREKLEKDEDFHILTSLFPHLPDVPKWRKLVSRTRSQVLMDKDMTSVVPSPTSTGSYGHYQSCPTNSITERNADESKPSVIFIYGVSSRAVTVCTDNTYQLSAVCEPVFQQ